MYVKPGRCQHCTANTRRCAACAKRGRAAAVNKYQRADPERYRAQQRRMNLKKNYGITPAQYDAMLADQDGACAICGTTEPGGPGSRLMVDHDHTTDVVRGLLCHHCNFMIGSARESVRVLARAIEYLTGRTNPCM